MRRQRKLVERIENSLLDERIEFETEVAIGGVQPDFVVRAADGRTLVIDAKAWDKAAGFRNRAAHQAELYEHYVGADRAFVVVESLERSRVSEGVVTLDRLVAALKQEMAKESLSEGKRARIQEPPVPHVFAAMPFDPRYDDTYFVAMAHAAESIGAACRRVDREEFSGDIVGEIQALIRSAIAVIVDLSESRPNVLYEAGYSHALERPTIHICSTPLRDLPFDVAHWNTIRYRRGQTHDLRTPLARRLRAIAP
jgi:hypothetical protein